jgi:hypothetical protein
MAASDYVPIFFKIPLASSGTSTDEFTTYIKFVAYAIVIMFGKAALQLALRAGSCLARAFAFPRGNLSRENTDPLS